MRSWTLLFVATSLVLAGPLSADEATAPLAPTTPLAAAPMSPPDPMDEQALADTVPAADSMPAANTSPGSLPETAETAPPHDIAPGIGSEAIAESVAEAIDEAPADSIEPVIGDELAVDLEPTPEAAPLEPGWDQMPPTAAHAEPKIGSLGPLAVDAKGQKGRIHTVLGGDTLWDISEAYLGTPWVWPSIWTDNDEIENPHLIMPGDRVWVTAGEMRKVSKQEADRMIAAGQEIAQAGAPTDLEDMPAAPETELIDEAELMAAEDVPAAMDELPVAVPLQQAAPQETGQTVRVSARESMGFVTKDIVDAATSIIDSPSPRTWMVDGDRVYLGLGEGEVEVGDEFTIFREAVGVVDIDGERLLGYHVDALGWAVVREVDGESSIAEVRISNSEIRRGDRVIPRAAVHLDVPIKMTPDGIEGRIVFTPNYRTNMADGDYVYINRGLLHGFEVGSEVEVYVPGRLRKEVVSEKEVKTPDRVVAKMVLVDVKSDSAVAYVVAAKRELEIGDRVRATTRRLASR